MSEPRNPEEAERKKRGFFSSTLHNFLDPLGHGLSRAASRIPVFGPLIITAGHILKDILGGALKNGLKALGAIGIRAGKFALRIVAPVFGLIANTKAAKAVGSWAVRTYNSAKKGIADRREARLARHVESRFAAAEKEKAARDAAKPEEEIKLDEVPDAEELKEAPEQNAAVNEQEQAAAGNVPEEEIPDFDQLIPNAPVNEEAVQNNPNGEANQNADPALDPHVIPGANIFKQHAKDVYAPREGEPLARLAQRVDHEPQNLSDLEWANKIARESTFNSDLYTGNHRQNAANNREVYMSDEDWNNISEIMLYRVLDDQMRMHRAKNNGAPGPLEANLRTQRGAQLLQVSEAMKKVIQQKLMAEAVQRRNEMNGYSMKDVLGNAGSSGFRRIKAEVLKQMKIEMEQKKAAQRQRNRVDVRNRAGLQQNLNRAQNPNQPQNPNRQLQQPARNNDQIRINM